MFTGETYVKYKYPTETIQRKSQLVIANGR